MVNVTRGTLEAAGTTVGPGLSGTRLTFTDRELSRSRRAVARSEALSRFRGRLQIPTLPARFKRPTRILRKPGRRPVLVLNPPQPLERTNLFFK